MTTTYATPEGTAADLAQPVLPHISENEATLLRSPIASALRAARADGYQACVADMSLSAPRPALPSFVRIMNQTLKDNDCLPIRFLPEAPSVAPLMGDGFHGYVAVRAPWRELSPRLQGVQSPYNIRSTSKQAQQPDKAPC